jgi:hypothetical protein
LYEVQRTLDGVMGDFGISYTSINEYINRLDLGLFDRTREVEVVDFLKTKFDGFDDKCLMFTEPQFIEADIFNFNSLDPEPSGSFFERFTICILVLTIGIAVGVLLFYFKNRGRSSRKELEPQISLLYHVY